MKVVIAGSAKLQNEIQEWVAYWNKKDGCSVLNYPKIIPQDNFDNLYPDVHKTFFKNIAEADVLFIANDKKNEINGYIEIINQVPTKKTISSEDHEEIIPLLYYLRLKEGIRVSPRLGSGYFDVRWMDITNRGFKMNNLSKLTEYVCESLYSGDLDLFKKKI